MNQCTGGSDTAMFPRLHIQRSISRSLEKLRAAALLNHGVVSIHSRCIFAASYQPPRYGAQTPENGSAPALAVFSVTGWRQRLRSTSVLGALPMVDCIFVQYIRASPRWSRKCDTPPSSSAAMQLNTRNSGPESVTICPRCIFFQLGREMSPAKRGQKTAVFSVRGTTTSGNTIHCMYFSLSLPE